MIDKDFFDDVYNDTETLSSGGYNFKEYQFNENDFVRRACIWYGGTKGGKSFHMNYCISKIKHLFARVVVFCPTNLMNNEYTHKINNALIHKELTEKNILQTIRAQIEIAEMYRFVNRLDVAEKVFEIAGSDSQKSKLKSARQRLEEFKSDIENGSDSPPMKMKKVTDVTNKFNAKLVDYIRACLLLIRNTISLESLDEDGRTFIKYMDINPNTLFVFDDCQEEMKPILKKTSSDAAKALRNLFTKGRHYFVTHFYTFQDDKAIEPFLRSNASVSILTNKNLACGFITRQSNQIQKPDQKFGLALCESIFTGNEDDFRKLIYFKDNSGNDMFQYHTAQDCGIYLTGSVVVNEYCDKIQEK
jgi:hypothetical protein